MQFCADRPPSQPLGSKGPEGEGHDCWQTVGAGALPAPPQVTGGGGGGALGGVLNGSAVARDDGDGAGAPDALALELEFPLPPDHGGDASKLAPVPPLRLPKKKVKDPHNFDTAESQLDAPRDWKWGSEEARDNGAETEGQDKDAASAFGQEGKRRFSHRSSSKIKAFSHKFAAGSQSSLFSRSNSAAVRLFSFSGRSTSSLPSSTSSGSSNSADKPVVARFLSRLGAGCLFFVSIITFCCVHHREARKVCTRLAPRLFFIAILPAATFGMSFGVGNRDDLYLIGVQLTSALTFFALVALGTARAYSKSESILRNVSENLEKTQEELVRRVNMEKEQRALLRDFRKVVTRDFTEQEVQDTRVVVLVIESDEAVRNELVEICRLLTYECMEYDALVPGMEALQSLVVPAKDKDKKKTEGDSGRSSRNTSPRSRAERKSPTAYQTPPAHGSSPANKWKRAKKLAAPSVGERFQDAVMDAVASQRERRQASSPTSTSWNMSWRKESISEPASPAVLRKSGSRTFSDASKDKEEMPSTPNRLQAALRRASSRTFSESGKEPEPPSPNRLQTKVAEALGKDGQSLTPVDGEKPGLAQARWKGAITAAKPGGRFVSLISAAAQAVRLSKRLVRVVFISASMFTKLPDDWVCGDAFVVLTANPEGLDQLGTTLGVFREGELQEKLSAKGVAESILLPMTVEEMRRIVRAAMKKHLADEYLLVKALGRGACGIVYKTKRVRDERTFALKEIQAKRVNAQVLKAAEAEADLLKRLKWPTVLFLEDTWRSEANRVVYLLMPIMEGGSLEDRIDNSESQKFVCDWYVQAFHGLTYLHSLGVLHRDLKPANLLIGGNGRSLRVGDMGSAVDLPGPGPHPQRENYVEGGVTTAWYASPELRDQKRAYASSDVFALAASVVDVIAMEGGYTARILGTSGMDAVPDEARHQARLRSCGEALLPMASKICGPQDDPKGLVDEVVLLLYWNEQRRPQAATVSGQAHWVARLKVVLQSTEAFSDVVLLDAHMRVFHKMRRRCEALWRPKEKRDDVAAAVSRKQSESSTEENAGYGADTGTESEV